MPTRNHVRALSLSVCVARGREVGRKQHIIYFGFIAEGNVLEFGVFVCVLNGTHVRLYYNSGTG